MFEITCPWVFLLLPLPLLIWFFLPPLGIEFPVSLRVPFFNAMQGIVNNRQPLFEKKNAIGILGLCWILIICALSGPRWIGPPLPLEREGRNIMLALDLSGSMDLADMYLRGRPVSRLTVVRRSAEAFVQQRIGDRIGLILFGTRAYLQTPLTYDRKAVLQRLEDATVGLAGQTTSIGDALGLAVKRLQDVPAKGRVIILLTDGANNSGVLPPQKAAELAKMDKIKVYTIGLGAESDPRAGGFFYNVNASSDLDEKTLKQVAELTGGRYFRATDPKSLEEIYETINQLETVTQEQATLRPEIDYYPWPLAGALVLFVFWLVKQCMPLRNPILRRTQP